MFSCCQTRYFTLSHLSSTSLTILHFVQHFSVFKRLIEVSGPLIGRKLRESRSMSLFVPTNDAFKLIGKLILEKLMTNEKKAAEVNCR